jgi:hemin uptake protein HemP
MTTETIQKIHIELKSGEKAYPCEIWLELVTPQRATELLNITIGNRSTMQSHLDRITHSMNTNKFDELADPIHISNTGKLINGHHRLMAIVKTGESYTLLIVRGLPENAFANLDQSKARTGYDTLQVSGYENYRELAPVIKCIIRLQKRIFQPISPSNYEVKMSAELHSEALKKYIKDARTTKDRVGTIPIAPVAAMYYIYGTADSEKYNQFIEGLNFNRGVVNHAEDTKHPITVLEKKIRSESAKLNSSIVHKSKGITPIQYSLYYAWIHKAWENFITGTTMSSRDFVESEKMEVNIRLFTYTESILGAFVID